MRRAVDGQPREKASRAEAMGMQIEAGNMSAAKRVRNGNTQWRPQQGRGQRSMLAAEGDATGGDVRAGGGHTGQICVGGAQAAAHGAANGGFQRTARDSGAEPWRGGESSADRRQVGRAVESGGQGRAVGGVAARERWRSPERRGEGSGRGWPVPSGGDMPSGAEPEERGRAAQTRDRWAARWRARDRVARLEAQEQASGGDRRSASARRAIGVGRAEEEETCRVGPSAMRGGYRAGPEKRAKHAPPRPSVGDDPERATATGRGRSKEDQEEGNDRYRDASIPADRHRARHRASIGTNTDRGITMRRGRWRAR